MDSLKGVNLTSTIIKLVYRMDSLKGVNGPDFINVYRIGSFNGHLTQFSQWGTQLTKIRSIWSWKESIGYTMVTPWMTMVLTQGYQLGRQLTPFKVKWSWHHFSQLGTQLTPFKTMMSLWSWKEYPFGLLSIKFQFRWYHCIPYWVNSEYTYDLKFALCTQWTSWKKSIGYTM